MLCSYYQRVACKGFCIVSYPDCRGRNLLCVYVCVRDRLGAKLSYQHAVNTSSFDHRGSGGNDNLRLLPALWKYLAIKQCFAMRAGGKRDSKVGLPSKYANGSDVAYFQQWSRDTENSKTI